MRRYSSTVRIADKQVPIMIEQFGTLDESINSQGYVKTLDLLNYAFALNQRATLREEFNVSGNLRGMCNKKKKVK